MSEELRSEYEFDYSQAKSNRFAAKVQRGGKLVVLDPDIAAAFPDSDRVNAVLRSLLVSSPTIKPDPIDAASPSV